MLTSEPNTLFLQLLKGKPTDSTLLLPNDWVYFPISTLYEESQLRREEELEQRSEEDLNIIRESLQYVLFLEESKLQGEFQFPSPIIYQVVSELSPVLKFYNLMKIFFLGDSFLDPQINHHLSHLYNQLMHRKLDFGSLGAPFDDFLLNFFDQFNSSSFGDATFSKYILAFLRMDLPMKYRKRLFTELGESSHILRIDIDNLEEVDLSVFLTPFETEQDILNRYITVITSSNLTNANSFIYWLGVHHISSFLFMSTTGNWLKAQLLAPVLQHEKVR